MKTARAVYQRDMPSAANVINSHKLHKINHNDDSSVTLKARVAPHDNKDCLKNELKQRLHYKHT